MARRVNIIEWFHPKPVACDEQGACLYVVNGKGPHTVEAVQTVLTPQTQCIQDHFRVCVGYEFESRRFKFCAQGSVIVNLSVEYDVVSPGIVCHGLMAVRRQIHDGQSSEAKSQVRIKTG